MKTTIKKILAMLICISMLMLCGSNVLALGMDSMQSVIASEKETLVSEKGESVAEREALISEKGASVSEKGVCASEKETSVSEKDALVSEKDSVALENDASVSETAAEKAASAIPARPGTKRVRLIVPAGASAEVFDEEGNVVTPVSVIQNPNGSQTMNYTLISGGLYSYISTVEVYYHATSEFTADAGTVNAAYPQTENQLAVIDAYSGRNVNTAVIYPLSPDFSPITHEYIMELSDRSTSMYIYAEAIDPDYEIHALYTSQTTSQATNGRAMDRLISGSLPTVCGQFLTTGGYSNDMTIRLLKQQGNITYYQDYLINAVRRLSLSTLSLRQNGEALTLTDGNGNAVTYDRDRTEYYLELSSNTGALTLISGFNSVSSGSGAPNEGGYYAFIGGTRYDDISAVPITNLNSDIVIEIRHADERAVSNVYIVHVSNQAPARIVFATNPTNAIVMVIDNVSRKPVEAEADGTFLLIPGRSYSYNVTANGFIGISQESFIPSSGGQTVRVTLERASAHQPAELPAQWSSFRPTDDNNGVVNYPVPKTGNEAVLYWASRFGEGYSDNACGSPIIVDDCLYLYSGTTIYKVDKHTGETLLEGNMVGASGFAITPPTYADGMIFIGLSNGRVQAFNAQTLESLWVYTDPLGGQPNCPIIYHDGYIYTGFWRSETAEASFVCISVTDENGNDSDEAKLASWRYISNGGFYWAGAYISDEFLMLGTDDGEYGYTTGYASVLLLDPQSGRLLDKITLPHTGDIRCSITYDNATNAYYFTTKGGYFYQVRTSGSSFANGSLRYIKLDNGSDNAAHPAMSTSTPTVYNGRAYVGVSGTSQFGQYSGHNISVLDLRTMTVAYSVSTQGYPQTSGILTTAYEQQEGYVYIYFFDNFTPGKLRVIKDSPNQTEPIEVSEEYYQGEVYSSAPSLFTPVGAQAEYAICSPVIDEDGTIYFKNDSAYLMAVGSTIDTLEISVPPAKTHYAPGETFNSEGMVVTALLTNGRAVDVTEYITYSSAPLTIDDTEFAISYPLTMYHDENGVSGVPYYAPIGVVNLTIGGNTHTVTFIDGFDGSIISTVTVIHGGMAEAPEAPEHEGYVFIGWDGVFDCVTSDISVTAGYRRIGDIDGDGELTITDVTLIMRYALSIQQGLDPIAMDVDGDGERNMNDAITLLRIVLSIR